MSKLRFEQADPEEQPASELLAEMRVELNDVYESFSRLDNPPLVPDELRGPDGAYLVGYEGADAVAGGGIRRLDDGVAEIKRMFVRPAARSRGVARALLDGARANGKLSWATEGPPRHGSEAGPRARALPLRWVR